MRITERRQSEKFMYSMISIHDTLEKAKYGDNEKIRVCQVLGVGKGMNRWSTQDF